MIGTRSITDMYMVVLASLSNSDKLDLIAKLSNSMRDEADKKRVRPNLRTCFKGDWSDIDADNLNTHWNRPFFYVANQIIGSSFSNV